MYLFSLLIHVAMYILDNLLSWSYMTFILIFAWLFFLNLVIIYFINLHCYALYNSINFYTHIRL